MVAISKKYVTIGVAIAAVAAVAIALVNSKKKKIAYNALASSAVEGITPRIIGGDTLDQDVWYENRRYLVKILDPSICGATLVSRRVVLTAARELSQHYSLIRFCLFDETTNPPFPVVPRHLLLSPLPRLFYRSSRCSHAPKRWSVYAPKIC